MIYSDELADHAGRFVREAPRAQLHLWVLRFLLYPLQVLCDSRRPQPYRSIDPPTHVGSVGYHGVVGEPQIPDVDHPDS